MKKTTAGLLAGVIMVMSATSAFAGDTAHKALKADNMTATIAFTEIDKLPEGVTYMEATAVTASTEAVALTEIKDLAEGVNFVDVTDGNAIATGESIPATSIDVTATVDMTNINTTAKDGSTAMAKIIVPATKVQSNN